MIACDSAAAASPAMLPVPLAAGARLGATPPAWEPPIFTRGAGEPLKLPSGFIKHGWKIHENPLEMRVSMGKSPN